MKHTLILLFLIIVSIKSVSAQQSEFEIEIRAEPLFNNAQVAELTTLTTSEGSATSRLITVTVTNLTDEAANDLFLDIDVSSSRDGVLMQSFQRNNTPFSLNPGEVAFISNLDIARGQLPNILAPVIFDASLTESGRNFLNRLKGINTLPPDDYTITVRIYRRNNSRNGGIFLAEDETTTGQNLIDSDFSISQIVPGDFTGSNVSITNPYPEFRWEGLPQQDYRLILIEDVPGESPQALIESVLSTASSQNGGATNQFDFEYLNVQVDGTSFQYPSIGSKPLRSGKTYHWQVFSNLLTTSGVSQRSSDIWSFKLREGTQPENEVSIDAELQELLVALIGSARTQQILTNNFVLFEIEIDNQLFIGESARDELLILLNKVQENRVKLIE